MTADAVGFLAVAAVLLAGSLGVVLSRNLFHAVLYLAVALVATGVVFLLLDSAFLFGVQLLLYAGGVVTVVVFAIMLTERLVGEKLSQVTRHLVNGAILSTAVLVGVLGFLAQSASVPARPPLGEDATVAIGRAVIGPFALPFELLGVLLVASLLGALYFARSDD